MANAANAAVSKSVFNPTDYGFNTNNNDPPAALPLFSVSLVSPPSTGAVAVDLGVSNTSLNLRGIGNSVYAGDGNVTLNGGAGIGSVYLGNGTDSITLGGPLNTIVVGDGNDAIRGGAGIVQVIIDPTDLRIIYGGALSATLQLALQIPLGVNMTNGNFGWFLGGSNNIGAFSGLGNADATSGNGNIGVFNGNSNGASYNGNGNIGALNGNLNGLYNADGTSGTNNGVYNVGVLNGNSNGSMNQGVNNGNYNGYDNLGVYNGNLNGNLNTGTANGNGNGQNNLGGLNGNQNGNGQPLVFQPPSTQQPILKLTGALDTIVAGNGNNTIIAPGGLSTVVAGDGANKITIAGQFDTVVAGNGGNNVVGNADHAAIRLGNGDNHVIVSGIGSNVVQTGSGNDIVQLSGFGNWVDAGAAINHNTIFGGVGGDTFVIQAPGGGYDAIYNFSLYNADQLDLTTALATTAWDGQMSDLGDYLHASSAGANTWLAVGGGAGTNVAELMGVQATLGQLLAHNSLIV
jgi:hypothetical protein